MILHVFLLELAPFKGVPPTLPFLQVTVTVSHRPQSSVSVCLGLAFLFRFLYRYIHTLNDRLYAPILFLFLFSLSIILKQFPGQSPVRLALCMSRFYFLQSEYPFGCLSPLEL